MYIYIYIGDASSTATLGRWLCWVLVAPPGACGPDPYGPPGLLWAPPGPLLAPLTKCWPPLGPCGPLRL